MGEYKLHNANLFDYSSILNLDGLKIILEDFYAQTKISTAIIDLDGNLLIACGWQDICTQFHRVHPETRKNCLESDTELTNGVPFGTFRKYKCKNNLWDVVAPLYLGNKHVANIFIGQFFFKDEIIDYNLFKQQAKKYGFNEDAYIDALNRVPIWSQDTVENAIRFYQNVSKIIGEKNQALIELDDFFTVSLDLLCIADFNGRFLKLNREWENTLGIPIHELQGKNFLEFVHPDDKTATIDELVKLSAEKPRMNFINRYRHKNGSYRYIEWRSIPHNHRIYAAARDITERKIEEFYQKLQYELILKLSSCNTFQQAGELILEMALNQGEFDSGGLYYFNSNSNHLELVAHRGLSSNFISQVSIISKNSPRVKLIAEGVNVYWKDSGQDDDSLNPTLYRKEGLKYIFMNPILNRGQIIAVINLASHSDNEISLQTKNFYENLSYQLGSILMRIRVEEMLKKQLLFEAELSACSHTLLSHNENALKDALDHLLKATGVSRVYIFQNFLEHELYIKLIAEVCAPNISPQIENIFFQRIPYSKLSSQFKNTLSQNQSYGGKLYELPLIDRELFKTQDVLSLLLIPIFISSEWFGFIGFDDCKYQRSWELDESLLLFTAASMFGNYFERRMAEELLHAKNHQLEDLVGELRRTQAQLVQQERQAAVGQLAAGIAHDFNNILTVLLGYAEMIKINPSLPPTLIPDLTQIISSGKKAAHLVQQILDFSRKSIRQPEKLDLCNFIYETLEFLKRTIPENIRIITNISNRDIIFFADRTQMQQLITNLLLNSRDAMPNGGDITIDLALQNFDKNHPLFKNKLEYIPGNWIILTIEDTGTGIPSNILPHIFEPFFTTKEVGKGTGLGLAQVDGIVRQYRGAIDVFSEIGHGTTFTIYFPCITPKDFEIDKKTLLNDLDKIAKGSKETILLVEDDVMVLKLNSLILSRLNYTVITAINGEDAIRIYNEQKDKIALVITDWMMPVMDGPTLLKKLLLINPNVKIIMISGYPSDSEIPNFVKKGIFEWLSKPVSLQKMAEVVARVLKSNQNSSNIQDQMNLLQQSSPDVNF